MSKTLALAPAVTLMGALALLPACGNADDDSGAPNGTSGTGGGAATGGSSGSGGGSGTGTGGTSGNGGGSDTTFTPPSDPGKGGFLITVSGEDLANLGYDWNDDSLADGDPPAFVDGWALSFEHIIVTVDKIRVNADPDKDEGNPQNLGSVVASASGPWAVDTTLGGDIIGKSGSPDERTVAITAFASQANGDDFDLATRYAFSYDLVEASKDAKLVNLDDEGVALYEEGQEKGWAMILAGTATYKGPVPDEDTVFAKIPTTVKFTLGMKNPSSYINCRNTDAELVGDDFPRGIQPKANESYTVQITVHTDHGFWDRLNIEGTPLHFDPIAANSSTYGDADSTGVVSLEDLVNVDFTGFKTKDGDKLPWRSLVSDYTAPKGQLKYDANGTSFTIANSLAGYLGYSASSGGHMNADGECEIRNNFTP